MTGQDLLNQHPFALLAAALVGMRCGPVLFWLLLKIGPFRTMMDRLVAWLAECTLKRLARDEVQKDGWRLCAPCNGVGTVRHGLAWPQCETCRGTGRVRVEQREEMEAS